ncbi:LRR receptor-like serine/threonine-protein kinase IOS1 [Ziziphus jujuba]|uniref:LRR receptor-like serine/threonine-protein kinase IOS1 n=1 Tax=Ziziphus jujuba TaxID=326968 RepID=A0A9B4ADB9_ZIZJJ|nr:LRR receptor-like serine/threonine-protein kinase IOS1 [Ziziphus jujuba]
MVMLRTLKHFLALLVATGGFALLAHAQNQRGFLSIDCSLPRNSSYYEKTTGLFYISDAGFTDSGESIFLLPENRGTYQQQMWSLRSFPEGIRNCYRINVTSGAKYLIRTTFLYGNYDGKNTLPKFDVHLGSNLWDTVSITDASEAIVMQIIHVPSQNYLHVCLVKTEDSSTPFITSIELRPLNNTAYQTQMGSLALVNRYDTGTPKVETGYRYPFDAYDRSWSSYNPSNWTSLSSSLTNDINVRNSYQPPPIVMSTAATRKKKRDSLDFWLPNGNSSELYYIFMHFAELQKLKDNQIREFNISYDDVENWSGPHSPRYLSLTTVFSSRGLKGGRRISIYATHNSTLPPIINAYEVYMVKEFLTSEADQNDVDAITTLKSTYGVKRNWQGDPCTREYLWQGVSCLYDDSEVPRIISLNLSSSGLTGEISPSISNLKMLQTLDLSNNNLTGSLPDFLSLLPNLTVLNLQNNHLRGSVPPGLLEKWKNKMLLLSVCGNQDVNAPVSCHNKEMQKKNVVIIVVVASVLGIIVVLSTVTAIWWGLKRKRQHHMPSTSTIKTDSRKSRDLQLTYSYILKITNNFERVIGKGGFGTVYHGHLGDTQVAVKMLSPSAVRGHRQFHAEVNLLMRVHHRNLTKLVGYCNDGTNTGLIYEYMANGNLQAHLSDDCPYILKWEVRLRIALHAAQGLEYLHDGCKPPIVHRDVKSTNILLNENLHAKLSDFGLSKTFSTDSTTGSHVSTSVVAGTPGYLDPVYYVSNRLNEKSDIYSFGVVLLEIITGRPAIDESHNRKIHICDWITAILGNGDIRSIVDPRLQGNFDISSAWKAVELAMNCVSPTSIQRPTMSQVVIELKDCLDKGLAWNMESRDNINWKDSIGTRPSDSITQLSPPPR